MSVTQQYLLDTYRARRLGVPDPPAPGEGEWQLVREWRDRRQSDAALAAAAPRRPRRPRRLTLRRLLRPGASG